MEITCHHCNSTDVFFDGELYQCIHCSYMWMPEVTLKEYRSKVCQQINEKQKRFSEYYKKDNSDR